MYIHKVRPNVEINENARVTDLFPDYALKTNKMNW